MLAVFYVLNCFQLLLTHSLALECSAPYQSAFYSPSEILYTRDEISSTVCEIDGNKVNITIARGRLSHCMLVIPFALYNIYAFSAGICQLLNVVLRQI